MVPHTTSFSASRTLSSLPFTLVHQSFTVFCPVLVFRYPTNWPDDGNGNGEVGHPPSHPFHAQVHTVHREAVTESRMRIVEDKARASDGNRWYLGMLDSLLRIDHSISCPVSFPFSPSFFSILSALGNFDFAGSMHRFWHV